MSRKLLSLSTAATLIGGGALADAPSVATDIAPVHALVARVMEGAGVPNLVIQPGASPHEYNLRPSEAAALQDAELVFWIGPDLTPWMEDAVATLSEGAVVTSLLEADGTVVLEFRESAVFEAHDHEHHDHDEHHDDHADHEDHDHGDDHGHDAHDHGHEDHAGNEHGHDDHDHDHDGHAHGDYDPHAWLSPDNAATWLNVIAAELSAVDPENAGLYFGNAAEARAELDSVKHDIDAILAPVRGARFVVFHDAYQYFETAFDFPASGAISISDATDPSPARIAEIQERVREDGIVCVLAEPQFNAGLVETILDGTDAGTAVIDPIGVDLELGPTLYPQMLRNMATALADCL